MYMLGALLFIWLKKRGFLCHCPFSGHDEFNRVSVVLSVVLFFFCVPVSGSIFLNWRSGLQPGLGLGLHFAPGVSQCD